MGNGHNNYFFLCLDKDFFTKQVSLRIPKTMIVFRHRSDSQKRLVDLPLSFVAFHSLEMKVKKVSEVNKNLLCSNHQLTSRNALTSFVYQ